MQKIASNILVDSPAPSNAWMKMCLENVLDPTINSNRRPSRRYVCFARIHDEDTPNTGSVSCASSTGSLRMASAESRNAAQMIEGINPRRQTQLGQARLPPIWQIAAVHDHLELYCPSCPTVKSRRDPLYPSRTSRSISKGMPILKLLVRSVTSHSRWRHLEECAVWYAPTSASGVQCSVACLV